MSETGKPWSSDPMSNQTVAGRASPSLSCLEDAGASPWGPPSLPPAPVSSTFFFDPVWTFGADAIDKILPGGVLEPSGLHEIKPATPGDWGTALVFALLLTLRRIIGFEGTSRVPAPILWCWSHMATQELGRLHGPGLIGLGLDPRRLIIAEMAKEQDVLWTLEEGLKSGALALAAGLFKEIALTPSRRLALAAQAHRTPGLVVTHPATPGAGAALTRWRIASARSEPHPLALSCFRASLTLERCRNGLAAFAAVSYLVEWSDATHHFRLVAPLADRAAEGGTARCRAGGAHKN
jgi:protein ImuA